MRVRLTQLDGKLPNLALMKLAHWHREQGDELIFTRNARRGLFDDVYDRVYGSAIFTFSLPTVAAFKRDSRGFVAEREPKNGALGPIQPSRSTLASVSMSITTTRSIQTSTARLDSRLADAA